MFISKNDVANSCYFYCSKRNTVSLKIHVRKEPLTGKRESDPILRVPALVPPREKEFCLCYSSFPSGGRKRRSAKFLLGVQRKMARYSVVRRSKRRSAKFLVRKAKKISKVSSQKIKEGQPRV
jgi:hypothetical protein